MYIGEYSHSVDAKGRITVPQKFRDSLGDEFIVTRGLDGCLFAFDAAEWAVLEQKLHSLPLINADARKMTRYFLAGAALCEADRQGRILLPAVLREHAGIDREAVMVGVGSRVEIWSAERWEQAKSYDDIGDIEKSMEGLGI